MDAKHTKGPWVARVNAPYAKAMLACIEDQAEGAIIAEMYGNEPYRSTTGLANARLIAAAPDLLAALAALVSECDSLSDSDDEGLDGIPRKGGWSVVELARAAIAKATQP